MAYDKNLSPVDWYIVSYLLRFVELDDASRNDPEKRFTAWENTVLVQAKSMDEAFSKVQKIARLAAKPYRGGPDGLPVKWEFVGVSNVLPVYEPSRRRSRDHVVRTPGAEAKNPRKVGRQQNQFSSVVPTAAVRDGQLVADTGPMSEHHFPIWGLKVYHEGLGCMLDV